MRLLRLVIARVATAALTLLLVSAITFAAVELIPGDAATRFLGRDATPEAVEVLRDRLGLNAGPVERYAAWLGSALRGDLGVSLISKRPVTAVLAPRLENSLLLALFALVLYLPLTLVPALLAAMHRDRALDHAISVLNLTAISMPVFLTATVLMILFVVYVPLFPAVSHIGEGSSLFDYLRALTLPAVSLAVVMAAYAIRMLRDNLIEILGADFVRMAELFGLSRTQVLLRHALPNALVPTLNVTALNIAFLVSGVVLVEKVYSYPGFGTLLVDAMLVDDTPVIQASVLIAGGIYIAANLAADLGAILLNPRLREA